MFIDRRWLCSNSYPCNRAFIQLLYYCTLLYTHTHTRALIYAVYYTVYTLYSSSSIQLKRFLIQILQTKNVAFIFVAYDAFWHKKRSFLIYSFSVLAHFTIVIKIFLCTTNELVNFLIQRLNCKYKQLCIYCTRIIDVHIIYRISYKYTNIIHTHIREVKE